jgi:hypothetical protein
MIFFKILFIISFLQILPDDFGNFLSMGDYSKIKLLGPLNNIVNCRIGFNDENRDKVKIGKGWKKFCTLNNITDGTCLEFTCHEFMFTNVIIVEKIY